MTEQAPAAAAEGTAKKTQFSVQRLYAKDISFEVPSAPAIYTMAWEPDINVQFSTAVVRLSEQLMEVVLLLTVKASLKEKVAYIAEARYAGIFHVEGFDNAAVEHLVGVHCPTILFPYGRELIGELISRGSFPQFILQPMNFEAIYADARRRRDAKDAADAEAPKH